MNKVDLISVPDPDICETKSVTLNNAPQKGDAKSGAGNKIQVPTIKKLQSKAEKDKAEKLKARKDLARGISSLARYMGRYAPALVVAIIVTIAAAALLIVSPTFMERLTNVIIDAIIVQEIGNAILGIDEPVRILMSHVARYGTMFMIVVGANSLLDFMQTLVMVRINNKVAMDLRAKISRKINVVPLSYYDNNKIGDILSRATNDVDRIGEALTFSLTPFLSNVTLIIGSIVMMFWHSWVLALSALTIVPLVIIIMGGVLLFSQKYFKRQADYLGDMNGLVEENFSGQTVIKAFNGQQKSEDDFKVINRKHYKASFGVQTFQGIMWPAMNFVGVFALVAVSVVGGLMFMRPVYDPMYVSIGMIMSFTLYIGFFQQAIGAIGESVGGLQAAAAASARVFDFLGHAEQECEKDKVCALTEENFRGKVEFKNVKFGYDPDKPIIHDFSAVVEPGQKVAIVGPTGAGKTTMVNLLMRFYDICGGQILIDGVDIKETPRQDIRSIFGMVLQDTWLFNGTIKENIRYSLDWATDEDIYRVCEAVGIDHFIKGLPGGYDMKLDDDTNIASGQKQLLTIARAMLQDSPCLILDEATSNIDTRTERQIQEAMDKLTKGRTSFVIAHRLSTIKNSDLIIAMKDGDVLETGSHDQLMSKGGFYAGLYNAQFTN